MRRFVQCAFVGTALGAVAVAAWSSDTPVALSYNFNGMVHSGEGTFADDPNGYRSIADRGLRVDGAAGSFGTNPLLGFGGIPYSIEMNAGVLDLVYLGNRNTVSGGFRAFDPNVDGDERGIQPNWLADPNQGGPQTTDVTAQNFLLDATAEIGLLFQISNGGGDFDVTLGFDDASSVTVTVNGPDWFLSQNPDPNGAGLVSQSQFGVFNGTGNTDMPVDDADLNVVESVISVQEMINDGVGNVTGKTLTSITFSNRSNTNGGYAVLAATVRTALGPPDNDECSSCTPVTEGTIAGSNARATGTDITPGCGIDDTRDVWYCYMAGATGTAEVRTCGSSLDTTVAVYAECDGALIACDDDACGRQSLVQFGAQAGVTYLIRVAANGNGEGNFLMTIENPVDTYVNTHIPMEWNFNGMTHNGEAGAPDDPNGFRAMSDRAMELTGGPAAFNAGGIRGNTGITYEIVQEARAFDMVHVGNRNAVDGGNWRFDPNVDFDDVGIQPNWLTDPNQGQHTSDVSGAGVTLDSGSEIGVLYNISNGGGFFDMTLGFSDATSVTVTLQGPDWFGAQSPDPNVDDGVAFALSLNGTAYLGTGNVDTANPDFPLNVVESVVSVAELMADGVGDFSGKTLTSISFGNRSNTNAGYGVYAVTHRTSGSLPCPGDCNGDGNRDLTDLSLLLSGFGGMPGACDIDGNGSTDLSDLALLLSNFGVACPS